MAETLAGATAAGIAAVRVTTQPWLADAAKVGRVMIVSSVGRMGLVVVVLVARATVGERVVLPDQRCTAEGVWGGCSGDEVSV